MTTGTKFSQLPSTPALDGSEKVHVLQHNLNRLTTISALTGAIGNYAVRNTNLISALSAHLLTEIQENDTLITSLSTIGIDSRLLLGTRIDELSAWVNGEFSDFEVQVNDDISDLQTEIQSVSAGAGSPVFITAVNNTLGLEQLVYQQNTVPNNYIITQATVDDDTAVSVTMEWDGPATEWMGSASINNVPVTTSEITRIGDTRRFRASKTLDLQGATEIEAKVNAETYVVDVTTLGDGPGIQDVTFGPPPTVNNFTPNHYIDGDQIQVTVEFDTSDVVSVTLYGDPSYASTGVTDLAVTPTGNPPQATFNVTIDTNNINSTQLPLKIAAKNSFGTQGDDHTSVSTIPCKRGPNVTNVTYGPTPTVNGYTPTYFLDGDTVEIVVELDNANASSVKTIAGSSYSIGSNNSINISTVGSPPSAVFNATVDTSNISITNLPGRFAARSDKNQLGVEYTSVTQIPVKYAPSVTNITVGEPPTTGGHQPAFFIHGDPLNIVVELDNANVLSVGRENSSGDFANATGYVNVTTTGTPPSASFTTTINSSNVSLSNKTVTLQARGPSNRLGVYEIYSGTVPIKRGPDITNVTFGAYPSLQTELKDGDTIQMTVEYDTNNVYQTQIVSGNSYAGQSSTPVTNVTNLSATTTLTIDTAVTTPTLQSVRLRARGGTTNNQYGEYHASVRQLTLNNVKPTFVGWSISYPASQTALKENDTATVSLAVNNQGNTPTYDYISPNNQLTITDPTTYNSSKTVTCNSVGSVNESTNNYKLTVNRQENNSTSTYNNIIFIADIAPTITVDLPPTMKSGGTHGTSSQIYTITTRSTQFLSYFDMDATTNSGSIGNWNNISQNKVWNAQMTVDDSVSKGTNPWVNITATSRSGWTVNTITTNPNYTLAGFVERTVTIPSLSRTVGIGTTVQNVNKLIASETFRDGITFDTTIADGTTLDPSLDTGVDVNKKFTIVNSNNLNVVDYNGDTFFYLDKTAAANNVSGTSQLTIEETT